MKKKNYKIYKNKKKIFDKKKQKITIVTVVYNGEKTLEKTIKNIINQNYSNFEYIVVYTPSKDKTFEIIQKYEKNIDKIIVNFDIGIYQSMNLGSFFAEGDYINYMNSGDYFFDQNIIKDLFKKKNKNDVIYGDCQIYYNSFKRKIFAKEIKDLKDEMIFSHQSCFVKTKIQKTYMFNKLYYYAADYDFFIRLYKKKFKFFYVNKILSKCMSNGIVDRKKQITLFQILNISRKYFRRHNSLSVMFKKLLIIIYHQCMFFIKLFIPKNVIEYFLKIKYLKKIDD